METIPHFCHSSFSYNGNISIKQLFKRIAKSELKEREMIAFADEVEN